MGLRYFLIGKNKNFSVDMCCDKQFDNGHVNKICYFFLFKGRSWCQRSVEGYKNKIGFGVGVYWKL